MKINVCIEANSIQEYMEAIQALAAGYQADPVVIEVPVPVEVAVAEEKPKATRKAVKKVMDVDTGKEVVVTVHPAEVPSKEKDVTASEEPANAPEQEAGTSKLPKEDVPNRGTEEDTGKADTSDNAEDVPEGEPVKEVTLEMIRGKAKQLAVAGFKAEIQAALKEFGAASLTKLKKEDYTNFYKYLENING